MANTKITQLTQYTTPVSTDVLPVVDVAADVTKKISIADLLKNASSGTAAAPGIAFDGDDNTGIYSAGPDLLGFSTAGTGKLFVDGTGRVGVGTATPIDALQVANGNIVIGTGGSLAGYRTLYFGGSSATARFAYVEKNNDSPYDLNIVAQTSTTAAATINFKSTPTTTVATIDSAGRMGIGTTSPQRLLSLTNDGNTHQIAINDNNLAASGAWWLTGNVNGQYKITQSTNATGSLTSLADRVTIDTTGNVGIGTAVPNGLLHISNNIGGNNQLIITNLAATNSSAGSEIVFTQGASGFAAGKIQCDRELSYSTTVTTQDSALVFFTAADGVDTEKMRITSAGRMGIGIANPLALQQLYVSDPTPYTTTSAAALIPPNTLQIVSNADNTTANTGAFTAWQASGTGAASSWYAGTEGGTAAYTGNFVIGNRTGSTAYAERLRLDSAGRVLVGTTVSRTATNTPQILVEAVTTGVTDRGVMIVQGANALSGPVINFAKHRSSTVGASPPASALNGDFVGGITGHGSDGTNFIPAFAIAGSIDGTSGTNNMPGRVSFYTTPSGSSAVVEQFRITNEGVRGYAQPAPAAVNATATLTVANLKTGIITSTTAAAVTMTLPTGTDTEAGFNGLFTNFSFEWSVINTGATNAVTVQAGTAHTLVGSGTVAAGVSGRFVSRRTAANTFVTYRLS